MKITENNLKKWDACEEGIAWFMKNKPFKSDIDCIEKLMQDKKGTIVDGVSQNLDWSTLVLGMLLTKEQNSEIEEFAYDVLMDPCPAPTPTVAELNQYLSIIILKFGLKLLQEGTHGQVV